MFSGLHCTDEGQQPETSTWMSAVCLDRKVKEVNDKTERNWGEGKNEFMGQGPPSFKICCRMRCGVSACDGFIPFHSFMVYSVRFIQISGASA